MAFFDIFRKNKKSARETAIVPIGGRSTLFSTDIDTPGIEDWPDILARSFQVLPDAFKRVDSSGHETDKITVSSAAPNGARFTHAMDAPSEGNPLSMKPILNPMNSIPPAQIAWYATQGFIGYQVCAILNQHWLIDKICTKPCRDAMRHGYELATDDDEEIDVKVFSEIRKLDRKFKIKKECVEFARFNRIFGLRIALPVVDSPDPFYYQKPFDIKNVKPGSYKGISQIDPYWITPELDIDAAANPASIHFYEPTWWRVNGIRIHRTHLVIIKNGVPADVLKPTYYFGGIPVPQKIAERVYAAERTANEGPQLALTKRTTWMKVDISQALANLQTFLQKISFFSNMRDNYGVKIGGLDDEMQQFDTNLTDFDEMTMTQYKIACAAGDCDAATIMGDSPKGGLGSEGQFNTDAYNEFKESIQSDFMEPLLERHHELLMVSEVAPMFGSEIPTGWKPVIKWNSVDTPSAKEQADIKEIESRIGNNLVNSGAIDGVDERNRLMADKKSGYNGLADREPEEEDLSEEQDVTGDIKSDKSESGEK
jgi:hypothetical protein